MRKALLLAIAALLFSMNAVTAKEIQVKGYTKKDGTKVAGYTKIVKDKGSDKATDETEKVAGYTKKDGTKVAGYTRKKKAKDPTDGAMSTGAPSKDSEKAPK